MGDHLRTPQRFICLLAIVWLACVGSASAQSPIRGLKAERFDVALTLLPDGSVDVRETVVFHFTEKTFTKVDREVPINRFDGVIDVRASLDGHPLGGDGSERVRIRKGRDTLRVTWSFPETIDRSREFTLEYRAMGALSVANGRALMEWFVLPSRHRYLIDKARIEWRVPASAVRMEPTRLDDARWTTSALPDGWAATRQSVGIDETARLTDAFDQATLAVAVPAWQTNASKAREMAPAFIVCALTLLVVGAGIVAMTWFKYRLPPREPGGVEPARQNELPPAMGTALLRGAAAIGPAQMQATLLDLARQGVLQILESKDRPKKFDVVMQKTAPVRPHEEVVTGALWLQMKNGRVDLQSAWRHLGRKLPAFHRSLLVEMQEAGLVDAERRWAARGMRIAGFVVIALGMAGFILFRTLFGHLGDVPLTVPSAVVVSGIMFCIHGQVMSLLSSAGVAAAARWRARRDWLKSNLKGGMPAAEVEQWSPIAAGFGLGRSMLKSSHDPSGALAVIIATTSSSAHGGGGAVGGGAAGGGSSSAS